MASLSLSHINKTYPNGFEAVKDFNLEIEDKEFIIFVGPSGCGKSTTLRMIAGLEEISGGTLKIGDKVMNDVEPKDRDIAMVFQNYALYPHMTVYDNMAFGLKLRKVPKDQIDQQVREAARILDLEKLLDRKPKALSGGQRQRVAMGRAIVRNPKVFLMDEPLSNLDAKLRVQMRIEISKIHQRLGATIIYVTHDQTEAMTLGTRIVVMKDGVVQQVDTPQNLYQKPGNLFVAGFMGSPQMNFLDAEIKENGSDLVAKIGSDEVVIPAAKAKVLKDKGYVGKTVVMGIRPEDVSDSANGAMSSVVKVYELLGAEVFLYFDVNGTQITARVDPRTTAKTGDPIRFDFDMDKAHFFDKESELVITN
ncbi:sn-glycerol-3-phosphate ABC transporter ATP-binding protein UgpC [Blautia glucerasea]